MNVEKKDKEYAILQRIKALNGKKQLILDGEPKDSDTELDIDNKIKALTNIFKML